MSLTVYKYLLAVTETQRLTLPREAKILTVQTQNGNAMLWALIDPSTVDYDERLIHICGTGHAISRHADDLRYIATFQLAGGELVFHVFEGAP